MPLIIPSNSISDGGYVVDNSLRFNDGSSDNLARTPSSASNQKTWTWSGWVKRASGLGTFQIFFGVNNGTSDSVAFELGFNASNQLVALPWNFYFFKTNAVYRDTSSWYHVVFAFDTTQATSTNRFKLYVNGEQVTSFESTSYPSLNSNWVVNSTASHRLGIVNYVSAGGLNRPFDGYIAEAVLVDGQQLDPTSFGEFDEDSGIWKPIDVSGLTFGTNGFYLDFENSGSLGADVSGNGNNFTVNNLTAIDQTTDTPTNNFATYNSLNVPTSAAPAFSEGNLKSICNASGKFMGSLTIAVSSGKWFWEVKATELSGGNSYIGVGDETAVAENARLNNNNYGNSVMYKTNGDKRVCTNSVDVDSSYGTSYTQGDIIGVALNADDNQVIFYKNGTAQNSGTPVSIPTPTGFLTGFFALGLAQNETFEINTGSPPYTISSGNTDGNGYGNFEYAVPSGYLSLCTKNLSEVLG